MSAGVQLSPGPAATSVVMERRSTISTGIAQPSPQPGLVLPITTREARPRTASVASVASVMSSGPPRKSTACSVIGFSDAPRRRTSSVVSVMPVRKETWANIETPDAHWHPSGVSGLSFGVPCVQAHEPPRRRASSLLSVRSLDSTSAVVTQAHLAPAVPVPPPPPAQPAPSQPPPSFSYPSPYTVVQQPAVTANLSASSLAQPSPQPAPVVYDISSAALAAAPVVTTAQTGAPVMMPAQACGAMPNQVVQMPYGYMQAPGGGYMFVGMMPTAPMHTALPLQAQAQPIQLSSLITGAAGTAVQAGATYATMPTVAAFATGHEAVTTVMLRNIPQKYDREALLDVLNKTGFAGSFDFFYLPIDFSTTNSVGYAFINFVSESELARFRAAYVGKKLSEESPKVCEVCDAKLQGKAKNVDFYRNSTVMGMDEKYHPILIENGVRVPFPKPTRPIGPVQRRPPRTHPKQV